MPPSVALSSSPSAVASPQPPFPLARRRALAWASASIASGLLVACGSPPPSRDTVAADRAYRTTAARHLYARNNTRIYPGMLPPMLYAVGVLQVHLDGHGRVQRLNWLRAPTHAPEVIQEIERTVRSVAPYPSVPRGGVTFTDTWLWDRSGRFQLDTLTEGQRQQ